MGGGARSFNDLLSDCLIKTDARGPSGFMRLYKRLGVSVAGIIPNNMSTTSVGMTGDFQIGSFNKVTNQHHFCFLILPLTGRYLRSTLHTALLLVRCGSVHIIWLNDIT